MRICNDALRFFFSCQGCGLKWPYIEKRCAGIWGSWPVRSLLAPANGCDAPSWRRPPFLCFACRSTVWALRPACRKMFPKSCHKIGTKRKQTCFFGLVAHFHLHRIHARHLVPSVSLSAKFWANLFRNGPLSSGMRTVLIAASTHNGRNCGGTKFRNTLGNRINKRFQGGALTSGPKHPPTSTPNVKPCQDQGCEGVSRE